MNASIVAVALSRSCVETSITILGFFIKWLSDILQPTSGIHPFIDPPQPQLDASLENIVHAH